MPPFETEVNILLERYHFHHRKQKTNETLEEFPDEVCRLAESCEFGDQKEWLVRDHVLFGLEDKQICLEIVAQGGDPSIQEVIELCESVKQSRERNMRMRQLRRQQSIEQEGRGKRR